MGVTDLLKKFSDPAKDKPFNKQEDSGSASGPVSSMAQPKDASKKAVDLAPTAMSEFNVERVIGTGSFGRVSVAKHKKTGVVCAIKALSKAAMIKNGQVKHVKEEKDVMKMVSYPFFVGFRGSFQDDECVFIVMEYIPGGEFFTHLRDNGRLSEDKARFYAAQIVLGLEHLHTRNIVYRDLKPENLLMDKDGYLRITDFGFAKVVHRRTFTLCGTPDYLAPEIILNKGHGKAVDWWALGVLIYEMISGFPPFYDEDQMNTYKKILAGQIQWPAHFGIAVRDLVKRLLQADLTYRIGTLAGGADDVKNHPWFQGIDWALLEEKKYKAPYVPKLRSDGDSSNFDDYSKLPPFKHEFKLSAEQQAQFQGF